MLSYCMTVLVGYRIAGVGCVLGADGRASESNGRVITDDCRKVIALGTCVVAVCGADGRALQDLEERGARTYAQIVEYVREREQTESHWGFLVYDRRTDRLLSLDSDLGEYEYAAHATAGAGGQMAMGVVASMRTPHTLEAAARVVRRAIALTCAHNTACGGQVAVLTSRARGSKTRTASR